MRPGEVVTIRINPTDCMGIADMLAVGGINTEGMSFAQAAATVLQSLLEAARMNEVIPIRDGFAYSEVMMPFARKKKGPPKGGIIAAMNGMKNSAQVAREVATVITPAYEATAIASMSTEQRRAGLRMKELQVKQEYAKDSWSAEDQKEWDDLYKVVFPDG